MALRVYLECCLDARNAVHLFYGGDASMSNPFDDFSPEIIAGWFARVSSSERWEMEKEDFWQCCASDQSGCKGCNWFEDNNCEASFNDECPQVIAEFNLDEKHFN